MATIIKEGKLEKVTCNHCGCEYEITRNDIFPIVKEKGWGFWKEYVTKVYTECPYCHHWVLMPNK